MDNSSFWVDLADVRIKLDQMCLHYHLLKQQKDNSDQEAHDLKKSLKSQERAMRSEVEELEEMREYYEKLVHKINETVCGLIMTTEDQDKEVGRLEAEIEKLKKQRHDEDILKEEIQRLTQIIKDLGGKVSDDDDDEGEQLIKEADDEVGSGSGRSKDDKVIENVEEEQKKKKVSKGKKVMDSALLLEAHEQNKYDAHYYLTMEVLRLKQRVKDLGGQVPGDEGEHTFKGAFGEYMAAAKYGGGGASGSGGGDK